MHRPEDKYVKVPALAHATRLGWHYHSIRTDESGTDYDPDTNIFYRPFTEAMSRLNPDMPCDDEKVRFLIRKIGVTLAAQDLGRAFHGMLINGLDGYRLIDFDNSERNDFTVVTELTYANGDDNFRPDIVFLVNGMPLCFMEAKRIGNRNGVLAERERMRARFSNTVFRRFANITQIMAFSNNEPYDDTEREPVQGSFYATSAYGNVKMNRFREEPESRRRLLDGIAPRDENTEKSILQDNSLIALWATPEWEESMLPENPANSIITSLFSHERLLFLLRYVLCYKEYTNDDGIRVIEKHIMRYPQFFASKAVRRTLDNGVQQGVIWHTQGSGKTELAFLLTRYLRDYYQRRNHVLHTFFIVDRLDLADQATDEFTARGAHVLRVESRAKFVELLRKPSEWAAAQQTDASSGVTIAVVNIQKFSDDATGIQAEYGLNEQRLFFIDEAHREYKPGKSFLSALFNADRSAVRIALTGTPLIRQKGGADTKQVFGDYIHTYFYDRSIADGYTLRLLREDIRPQFRVKMRKIMEQLEEVDKLTSVDEVCEHPHFVDPLTEYIVDDLIQSRIALGRENEGIGAMVVARTSQQARNIFDALQKYDTDISSALVLYDEGTKKDRREIQRRFKRGEIDILVVYNMLLTGFDAPRLKKMYLCRALDAHNLLQALTRVNRPYKKMDHGFVVDFVDISKQFDKTNRDYLAELNNEFGDETDRYASMFENPETIKTDLEDIKNTLWEYSTNNQLVFSKELESRDEDELYKLRRALEHYKELRNLATLYGHDELQDRFDIGNFQQLINEVNLRISRINLNKTLAAERLSTGALNRLMENLEFEFVKQGTQELTVADKLKNAMRTACDTFNGNRDPKDPKFVNLMEELGKKLRRANMEETKLTTDEMTDLIDELEELKRQADEINRRNDMLANKYDGDEKYMRIHKEMMADSDPVADSDRQLFGILSTAKKTIDAMVGRNAATLDQPAVFKRSLGPKVIQAFKDNDTSYSPTQLTTTIGRIYNEYSDERKNHLG
ncbi:DEAD/DEAH box helicase family protein [Bifidobacterium jacchi]|uniref:type I site-specific deoxyribonuclease n=1 Tax=Bifidobacterium jacchi TaxID=2490545 RepID=A0A5N5RGH0_9BIFI|nr:DEAD/DEAH box helicase family protein [Bifidobacterium jacchi]KAB5606384.1 type I restriction endonuclease subunit R [Bifidobacterium jacchi]